MLRGGRPAFLLDYAGVVPVSPLEGRASALSHHLVVGAQGGVESSRGILVLTWGESGCHLLCNVGVLLSRIQHLGEEGHDQANRESRPDFLNSTGGGGVREACDLRCPRLIGFGEITQPGSTGMSPTWVSPADARKVLSGLKTLSLALESTVTSGVSSDGAASAPAEVRRAVNLDLLSDLPLMPTLNGWLLGYPVVYYIRSADEAQAAARCLSSDALSVFRATLPSTAVASVRLQAIELAKDKQNKASASAVADPLACICLGAFSVPSSMVEEFSVDFFLQKWADDMNNAISKFLLGRVTWHREDRGIQAVSL